MYTESGNPQARAICQSWTAASHLFSRLEKLIRLNIFRRNIKYCDCSVRERERLFSYWGQRMQTAERPNLWTVTLWLIRSIEQRYDYRAIGFIQSIQSKWSMVYCYCCFSLSLALSLSLSRALSLALYHPSTYLCVYLLFAHGSQGSRDSLNLT